jgi:hypothetical protein
MATWPLPTVKPSSGFNLAPIDQTIRTDMEVGFARVRRRTTARNDLMQTSWLMEQTQVAIFRDWFENSSTGINGGATWFTISIPRGSTIETQVTARFKGPYTIDHVGGTFWKINGTLEIQ